MAHWLDKVDEIINASTHDLRELAKIAGYDPKVFYLGTSMHGLDLSGQDVSDLSLLGLDNKPDDIQYSARTAKEYIINDIDLPDGWGERVTTFRASRRKISSINQLSKTPNVKDVRISNTDVRNIDVLSNCKALERLYISGAPISDISALSQCRSILDIEMDGTNVYDLSPLGNSSPFYISVSDGPIASIEPLNVARLRFLDISRTPLDDISKLSYARHLSTLIMNKTAVRYLDALQDIESLSRLYVSDTPIYSFSPIARRNSELDTLYASSSSSIHSDVLNNFVKMKRLDLSNSSISDLEFVNRMPRLEYLNVANVGISDFSSLSGHAKITTLDCSRTAITDVAALSALDALYSLDISNTEVERISSLSKCKNLQLLTISECSNLKIEDIAELKQLRHIDMRNLPLSDDVFKCIPDSVNSIQVSYLDLDSINRKLPDDWFLSYAYSGAIIYRKRIKALSEKEN